MKGSSSEPIKGMSAFLQSLDTFINGTSDSEILISGIDLLLSDNKQLDNKSQLQLKKSIDSAKLPQELTDLLLDKVFEENTLLVQPEIPLSSQENKNEQPTHSSSLLKKLLQCHDIQQNKTVEAGQTIRNSYRLESIIGRGGMGKVWKALDLIQEAGEAQERHVAIKFIDQEIKSHPDALKALVREFARYKKLIHPNIVKAYELNHDENEIFIVMEYLQGISLKEFINQNPEGIPLKQAQPIIKNLCDALEYAHNEGIVHLDFKPSNIVYNPATQSCKIIDFGIARLSCSTERDKTLFDPGDLGAITTAYASSEMLMEIEPDRRDDIYGLACVVYELLSGKHPFNRQMAIKAERQKMQPNPVSALNKNEFNGLLHALSFQRQERTASANEFYADLFLPEQKQSQKQTRLLVIGIVVALAMTVIPYSIYTGYNNFKISSIINDIQQAIKSGTDDFIFLSVDKQQEILLNDPTLCLPLIKYAVAQKDAWDEINKFDPIIQQILFSNRKVRDYLINSYSLQIDQAISKDNFPLAEHISHNILQQYPDSLRLVEQTQKLKLQKKIRLTTLELRHQQCLSDNTKNLTQLFQCLQQTRSNIKRIDKDNSILSSSTLHNRYNKEVSSAIKNKKISLAEVLIANWHDLDQDELKQRSDLKLELAHTKKVEELNNQIQSSDNLQLINILTLIPTLESTVRKDVLSNIKTQKHLIHYYQQTTDDFLDAKHFDAAFQNISEAQSLFSKNNKQQQYLKGLVKKAEKKKISYINSLEKSLKKQFSQNEPDIQSIQNIISIISNITPEHPILLYPELSKNYTHKINTAVKKNDFNLAQRLLDDWKILKPTDKNTESFVRISERIVNELQAFQRKQAFTLKLQNAINDNQLQQVIELITTLKKQFSEQDQKTILSANKKQVLDVFERNINSEIQKYAFESAKKIIDQLQTVFPKNKQQIKDSNKSLKKAISARINDLLSLFRQAVMANELNSSAIFSPLHEINSIKPEYLNNNSSIFSVLKKRLLAITDNKDALIQLQTVINQWNQFLSDSPTQSNKNIEVFRKTKNLIALRCLFKGRKLKVQNQHTEANEFFMFGFSLDPINTVKNALEKELL